jgi:hypothetical protein
MNTPSQILSIYARALNQDDGCARWAFCCAIEALIGERWAWQVAPHSLTLRASHLVSDGARHRSPARQALIERSIIALSDRLRDDLILYVYDGFDEVEAQWSDFRADNRGDLACELALAKIWSGALWAPISRSLMVSLSPLCERAFVGDEEMIDHERAELLSHARDISREMRGLS